MDERLASRAGSRREWPAAHRAVGSFGRRMTSAVAAAYESSLDNPSFGCRRLAKVARDATDLALSSARMIGGVAVAAVHDSDVLWQRARILILMLSFNSDRQRAADTGSQW